MTTVHRVLLASLVVICADTSMAHGSLPGSIGLFDEIADIVAEHFYDAERIERDWQETVGAFRARALSAQDCTAFTDVVNEMLATLEVSHTHYYTDADPSYFELLSIFDLGGDEKLKGRFADGVVRYPGIGAVTREMEGRHFVVDVLAGSPAAQAGVRVGYEVLAVNAAPFHPLHSFATADEAVSVMVQREQTRASVLFLDITPVLIEPSGVFVSSVGDSARLIERDGQTIGYVRIYSYASPDVHEALVELVTVGKLRDADALVLDIRGGWGGANPEYLDLFNRDVPVLTMVSRDGGSADFSPKWRQPVVLLVDGGTRSGKEVLAHAFKTRGLGPVVGERTAGAVVGGRPFVLSDGSLLMLAVVDVLVDGQRLEGVGVVPDIVVPWDKRYADGVDRQLERALDVAAELNDDG